MIKLKELVLDKSSVANKRELVVELRKLGYETDQLFCKMDNSNYGIGNIRSKVNRFPDPEGMRHEFDSLVTLYNHLPENVVKPVVFLKIYEKSVMVNQGYIMQYLSGPTLERKHGIKLPEDEDVDGPRIYILGRGFPSGKESLVKDLTALISIMERLHKGGVGHGDAGPTNIILHRGQIRLIDPLPFVSNDKIEMSTTISLEKDGIRAYRNLLRQIR